ncbi:MAG: hypothetical protein KGM44_03230 [bacterium]|nr:hypothetical protein [bacterium]
MIPERRVFFGRVRKSLTILVVEDALGLRVEARVGRKLIARIDTLAEHLAQALAEAIGVPSAEMLA